MYVLTVSYKDILSILLRMLDHEIILINTDLSVL